MYCFFAAFLLLEASLAQCSRVFQENLLKNRWKGRKMEAKDEGLKRKGIVIERNGGFVQASVRKRMQGAARASTKANDAFAIHGF
jgi:hypothetical protein